MSYSFQCSCGEKLEIPENLLGKKAKCPKCSTIISIPEEIEQLPILEESQDKQSSFRPQDLFEYVIDSVVGILHSNGIGSGVFIDDNGIIATNKHVVGNNNNVTVKLNDTTEYNGKVIKSYNDIDLAFLKTDIKGKKFAKLGTLGKIKVGQPVYAIGHPLGLQNTLTKGVVSSVGRLIKREHYIQTDAPINPGNSGGPLFNEFAEVIGINTMVFREAQGLGFAIPIDQVIKRYNEIKNALNDILDMYYCGNCGNNSKNPKYCDSCGSLIDTDISNEHKTPEKQISRTEITKCKSCNTDVEPTVKYCPNCGTEI